MQRVRFGVIGVGGMGVAHATLIQRIEETELTGGLLRIGQSAPSTLPFSSAYPVLPITVNCCAVVWWTRC